MWNIPDIRRGKSMRSLRYWKAVEEVLVIEGASTYQLAGTWTSKSEGNLTLIYPYPCTCPMLSVIGCQVHHLLRGDLDVRRPPTR